MNRCDPSMDDHFGPTLGIQCRSFDFTLLFEQTILSIGPSSVFILLAITRILFLLRRRTQVVRVSRLCYFKIIGALAFACLQIATFAVWLAGSRKVTTQATKAAAVMSLLCSLILILLLHVEHLRSIRPSTLGLIWLFTSMLFDAVQTRTLFLIHGDAIRVAIPTALSVCWKSLLMGLELVPKKLRDASWNPTKEERSDTFGRDLFLWLLNLFRNGYRTTLTVHDLDKVDQSLNSASLHDDFIRIWKKNCLGKKSRPLIRALLTSSWEFLLLPVFPRLFLVVLRFSLPFLVGDMVTYANSSDASPNTGYGLIGAFALLFIGLAISRGRYSHYTYRWVTHVRGNLVSLIYNKSLTLKYAGSGENAAISLMSTDIERISMGLPALHEIGASVIETAIAIWLLARQVSYAAVACAGLVLLCTALSSRIGPPAGVRAGVWAGMIQSRVAATNDYLQNIRSFRMAGLGASAAEYLQELRVTEVAAAMNFRDILTIGLVIAYMSNILSPFLTFASYTGLSIQGHGVLDSTKLFTTLSIISLLTTPMNIVLQMYPTLMATFACLGRIEEFGSSEDFKDERLFADQPKSLTATETNSDESKSPTETGYHLRAKAGIKKSPFSGALLNGDAIVGTNVSFGWEDGNLAENAHFRIKHGQVTVIRGLNGSGKSTLLKVLLGELPPRQGSIHVSTRDIAFCDQTAWLPNTTVQQCILGYNVFDLALYSQVVHACALDEDFSQMEEGDRTKIGNPGAVRVSGGQMHRIALARAIYAQRRICLLDDVLAGLDNRTQNVISHRLFGQKGIFKRLEATVIVATPLSRHLDWADQVLTINEDRSISSMIPRTEKGDSVDNFDEVNHVAPNLNHVFHPQELLGATNVDNDKSRQIGDWAVYKYYAWSIGAVNCAVYFVIGVTYTFLNKFPEIWMQWWAVSNETAPDQGLGKWIGIFALLAILNLIVLGIWSWFFFNRMVATSGITMHNILIQTIRQARMSFFRGTSSGETINRFSQDLSMIDGDLPIAFFNFILAIYLVLVGMLFIAISSGYAALSIPFVGLALYAIQRYYLRTSKQIRIMDLEAKAPLYAHFTESASGLVTLRAFGWTRQAAARNEEFLAYSQKPFYLLFAIQRWLGLVLDLVVAGVATVTVGIAVGLHGKVHSGWLGLAMVNIITLSERMNSLVTSWVDTEASMGSIARIKAIRDTLSAKTGSHGPEPPSDWPSAAAVEFSHVSCCGDKKAPDILRDVSLSIRSGEKIGICGRTGSGKSTLIGLLFRFNDPSQGTVTIDGLNLSNIEPEVLCTRITGVAQDAGILRGTVRDNLPKRSDSELIAALEQFELWHLLESHGGLDCKLVDLTLSHGQKQLFCFVRAYMSNSPLLVLDEATSSMTEDVEDTVKNALLQDKDRTIIAIAHRLRSIAAFDRIIVLKEGRFLEVGTPQGLLNDPDSEFSRLSRFDTAANE